MARNVGGGYDYLLKADDDTFVNMHALLGELDGLPGTVRRRLYMGYFSGNNRPDYVGRWAEPNWWACDYYVPYAMGGGYILSAALAQRIGLQHELYFPYNSEDVSLGLWLAPFRVARQHDVRFNTEDKNRGCFSDDLVIHRAGVANMTEMQANLDLQEGKAAAQGRRRGHCREEFKTRGSYRYDWSAPPSACCLGRELEGTPPVFPGPAMCTCATQHPRGCTKGAGQCRTTGDGICTPYHVNAPYVPAAGYLASRPRATATVTAAGPPVSNDAAPSLPAIHSVSAARMAPSCLSASQRRQVCG